MDCIADSDTLEVDDHRGINDLTTSFTVFHKPIDSYLGMHSYAKHAKSVEKFQDEPSLSSMGLCTSAF